MSAQNCRQSSLSSSNSPLRPVIDHPQFEPSLHDRSFHKLRELGLYQPSHYGTRGRWRTHAELTDPSGLYKLDFLRALQLSHFLGGLPPPPHESQQPLTTLEELCTELGAIPHTLSLTYAMLIESPETYQIPCLAKWERDLNCHFTDSKKQHIL